ncbi:MAG: Cof-type HAD-IIB family hydrolase [Clostridium sp.]|nr:Cof-type HAD-IIB family hydrolase [Clostridium sp.]
MKKALFFDIDGTLVSFDTHRIPDSAVEAIARARAAGHKIVISTGRPRIIINNLSQLQSRGLIDAYITMNGAYVFCGDDVLSKSPIPKADARAIAEMCAKEGIPCIFVRENSISIAGSNQLAVDVFAKQLMAPPIPPSDYQSPLQGELFQITPFLSEDQEGKAHRLMPGCQFGRWHPAFVDVTAKGATKAHGLEVVCKHFGMSLADAIAFGDGGNDVPMLKAAGIGVAMGNANDNVKRQADFVTDTVDNGGIAKVICQILDL